MRTTWHAAVVMVAVVAGLPEEALADTLAPRPLRLHREAGHLFSVDVLVNGTGPYRFLVDTGSTRTLVSPAVAHAARVDTLPGARIVTPNGARAVRQAWIGLRLGPLEVERLPVSVLPLELAGKGGVGADGILGNDVLRRTSYVLDLRAQTLELVDRPDALDTGDAIPFAVDGTGRMQVEVTTEWSGGDRVSLVVDSGASALVLFANRLPQAPALRRVNGTARVRTVTASSSVQSLAAGWVSAGTATWERVPAFVAAEATSTAAGLLPLSIMRRVVVDNTARTITFER